MNNAVQYSTNNNEFVITDYNHAKPFASFFPGIAGLWGKPMWVFYVNRGQAIACMGTRDKDGAITEFVAANKAYRQTSLHGFRTFIKIKGATGESFHEPFRDPLSGNNVEQTMRVTSHALALSEVNRDLELAVTVNYFTLPNESIPALIRVLNIENTSKETREVTCVDGLPMINPYGTSNDALKNVSCLAEGWFSGVEFTEEHGLPIYKLKVEPLDRPEVIAVKRANFYAGYYVKGQSPPVMPAFIVDPEIVFEEVTDFTVPLGFIHGAELEMPNKLTAKNKTPCGMGYFKTTLEPGGSVTYYSTVGNVGDSASIEMFFAKLLEKDYIAVKQEENREVITRIQQDVLTKSSSPEFDNYCRQTYLDNLLRGGYPVTLGAGNSKRVYYAFSRVHGDMEREYNNFLIRPEYFSQGNGNHRDVNQNRRNDVFFNPDVKAETLTFFINLIQLDGYNPMGILGSEFRVRDPEGIVALFAAGDKEKLAATLSAPFTLGALFDLIETEGIDLPCEKTEFLDLLMRHSERIDHAVPNEGYWTDHWHYNLDLIEAFLGVYPDELENLLLRKNDFTFYDNYVVVVPRAEKHVLFHDEPRQLDAVFHDPEKEKMIEARTDDKYAVRTEYGKGSVYRTTLIAKLISLVCNKYASLDPSGVGVEHESQRSNWNDAMNGLPGLFGSSLNETLELKRLLLLILDSLDTLGAPDAQETSAAEEIVDLLLELDGITSECRGDDFIFWDRTHTAKEKYWQQTCFGLSGEEGSVTIGRLKDILKSFIERVEHGIVKGIDPESGIVNTYFENMPAEYDIVRTNGEVVNNWRGRPCINITQFTQKALPLFLEGPVHYLRTDKDIDDARRVHKSIMKSGLYDTKLKMFKVNAPLEDTRLDVGRIQIFTRGWLENESIWLHMEHKYLLELLRWDLAEEFYEAMKTCLVPFMDPAVYGRSIFENVSFIVSSAHPEEKYHGRGFVARLSGVTAEFLSIWRLMTAGLSPFFMKEGQLCLSFKPKLAGFLFTKKPRKLIQLCDALTMETKRSTCRRIRSYVHFSATFHWSITIPAEKTRSAMTPQLSAKSC